MRNHVDVLFRPATVDDLPELVDVQEEGAVTALAHIFPQDAHPFPREAILERWGEELREPATAVYVSTDEDAKLTGFAARRGDELLHFGTAKSTWGSGLARSLHDALLTTYPADLDALRLRVFAENHRARRFWDKLGWRPTGQESRSPFAPHPLLLEYELRREARPQLVPTSVTVTLLADRLDAAQAVATMRWQEWGHPPEPEDPAWWLETTLREAGRDGLPVTFVAHDEPGEVLGAVGLDTYDLDERHDTSPWVTGMIVRRDRRGEGVGRTLMQHLERWAARAGIVEAWVGTDLAGGFYQRCGWALQETFTTSNGEHMDVLHKRFL